MSLTDALRLPESSRDSASWWGLGEVVRLAVPMVLSSLSYTIMQFVDGWMVSKVSEEAMSAQFFGGLMSFVPVSFFMGILLCVSTFASQNLGARRPGQPAMYGWQGLWVAWAAAALLALAIWPAPRILGLFGHEPGLLRLETQYFRILTGGAFFGLSARALASWFVGIHRPGITLVAGIAANLVNIAGNWVLIYGHLGFPAMGLAGAGIATVVGMAVEALILAWVFVRGPVAREFGVRRQLCVRWAAVRELLRVGSPAGAMFCGDVLMWAIFMGRIVGSFGTAHLAAAAILNRYWHLCFMPAIGVSAAVTAIVGRYCGAGRPQLAWRRAHAGWLLVEAYMVSMGLAIWLARDPLVAVFNDAADPVVQSIATRAVIFILLCQAFDAMNVIFIGALRGAGDTLWPGAIQIVLAYVVGLGGAFLVAWARPEWESFGPWAAVSGYVMLLGCLMWGRFLRGRWREIRIVEPLPAVPDEPAVLPPA